MKCIYIFKPGDHAVLLGKHIVGDKCKCGSSVDGYCYGHAMQLKMIPAEKLAAIKAKRLASAADGRVRRRSKADGISKRIADRCSTSEDGRLLVDPIVLDAMGLNTPCDLATEYATFLALNIDPTVTNYAAKMAFARWLETPEHLREPRTLKEAGAVLGVDPRNLTVWKTSPDIINFINQDVEARIAGLYKLTIYRLGEGIQRGDKGCMEIFLKHNKEKQDANRNKTRAGGMLKDIPKEMLKTANDFAESTGKKNYNQALKAEKELINSKYFTETLPNGEEIKQ